MSILKKMHDFLEKSIVYSGLKPWHQILLNGLKNIVLCGPSLELGIGISSAKVQKNHSFAVFKGR